MYIYYVAMVTAGLTPLYIHLIKIQHSINHGQLVYMSAIHLLMFGSLFVIYPSSLRLSGNILLTSRCISAHIHLFAMLYRLHVAIIGHIAHCTCIHVYVRQLTTPSNATVTTAEMTTTRATLSRMKSYLSESLYTYGKMVVVPSIVCKKGFFSVLGVGMHLLILLGPFAVTMMRVATITEVMNMAPPARDLQE